MLYLCGVYVDINDAKHMKKPSKTYYIALNKAKNTIILSTVKTHIAKFIGISTDTLNRKLNNQMEYTCEEYNIWCNVKAKVCKRGWGIRH